MVVFYAIRGDASRSRQTLAARVDRVLLLFVLSGFGQRFREGGRRFAERICGAFVDHVQGLR
jgi:hypothetical protein